MESEEYMNRKQQETEIAEISILIITRHHRDGNRVQVIQRWGGLPSEVLRQEGPYSVAIDMHAAITHEVEAFA